MAILPSTTIPPGAPPVGAGEAGVGRRAPPAGGCCCALTVRAVRAAKTKAATVERNSFIVFLVLLLNSSLRDAPLC
jgi:hypothetical protein